MEDKPWYVKTVSETLPFALREEDGSEPSEFSGNMPRQAALKGCPYA